MNVTELRRNMRTGGWARHARRLPSLLLEHGIPFQRTLSGHTVRISFAEGGLSAHVRTDSEWLLIADTKACHVPIDSVPVSEANPMAVTTVRMPPAELARLDATCKRVGTDRASAIRRAIKNYLDALEGR